LRQADVPGWERHVQRRHALDALSLHDLRPPLPLDRGPQVAQERAVSARGFEAWDEPAAPIERAAWARLSRSGWRAEHGGATYSVSWNRIDGVATWVAYRNSERLGKAGSWIGLTLLLPEPLRVSELPR
jgi:hypothetical protein